MKIKDRYNQIIEYSEDNNKDISAFYKTLAREYEFFVLSEVKQLEDVAQEMLEVLEKSKREHYYCDDSWYSCPEHPEGCTDESQRRCNCGANDWNKYIDRSIQKIKNLL